MTRKSYRRSLADLRADVRSMGDLVSERLGLALESVESGAENPARTVIDGDEEINETYLELENRCVDLIALQQPVAGDLRFVTASFKIITDLERVGDLAVNLAQYALAERPTHTPEVGVADIGRDAKSLLERGLDAYESGDADACRAISAADDAVDALCQRASETVTRDLIGRGRDDPWSVERLLDEVSRVLLTIRDIERIADHAVNVAARTLYMVDHDPELLY
ncbi:phosphate signaling complex protein PhoU [Halobellus sp. GM3]|uniref:phosphate signaling complex protein PhoU n=1 Tax=Halobellus sp. GM3 TaxID=3458410 RepID=UPI00403E1C0F